MTKKTVQIGLSEGLEATPIALLVQRASQFESSIYVEDTNGRKVNAKSIMGMMSLGAIMGDSVTISAEGTDEEAAVNSIADYLTGSDK